LPGELYRNLGMSLGRRSPIDGSAAPNERDIFVEIRIGIINAQRELSFESSRSADEITAEVTEALSSGAAFVKLADNKGRVFLVPTAGIAYVEVGTEESRRIGFVG
jgi:Protein of unknown function (DUF3107)